MILISFNYYLFKCIFYLKLDIIQIVISYIFKLLENDVTDYKLQTQLMVT